MHKELLLMAFEKVRKELTKEGIVSPSDSRCAQELSAVISKTFPYGDRSLRDFYKEARNQTGDINIPQPQALLALSQYLGFENYGDFLVKNKIDEVKRISKVRKVPKRNKKFVIFLITLFLAAIIGFFAYNYFNKQRWMEWEETHYIEASFDSKKLKEGNLKAYKEERITDFEKVTPSCDTKFFNDDGSVRMWYGKNKKGVLEYFSSYGLHPQTGKTLKPITQYIIGKYICVNSKF
ncbi:MAG: hypothetical protein JJE55_15515 [Flavobacteriaceae bacterium]|nr:hypothetical protein [Flavobacteriaceae bacterium]